MIILILTNGNNAGSVMEAISGVKLPSEANLSNLFVHRTKDHLYVNVRTGRYNVMESIIGLSIAHRVILVFENDNGDMISLLEKVGDYLQGKSIVTCIEKGTNRNSVENTHVKLQGTLPNTFLSDIVDLSEGYDELRSLIDGKDYDNQPLAIKEIILNRLTHAGLGRGYEVLNLKNDDENLLNQRSVHIGCVHGNSSGFLNSNDWQGNDENLPVLVPEDGENIELGYASISTTGKGINFNIYSNDGLKIINVRNLILDLAEENSCRNDVAFLNLDIKKEHLRSDTTPRLHDICLDIKGISFSSGKDLHQHCNELLRRHGLSLIPTRSRVRVLKIFEKVTVGKNQRRIIGCRLINGSFAEKDFIVINDGYYRIDQVGSGKDRSKNADAINTEYGLLLDREDFTVNPGSELTIHEHTYGDIIRKNQKKD